MRALIFLMLFWPLTAIAESHAADPSPGRLTVTGTGEVTVAPDMATLTMGATSEGKTAAEALALSNTQVQALLARLTAEGVARRDMQTSGLSLSPRWDHSSSGNRSPKITGYVVSNNVTVRVRDLPALGKILDAVVKDGANQFHGLQFGVAETDGLVDEARRLAVADARRKADLLADAAGVELGRLLQLNEQGVAQPPVHQMARMESMADAVPVAEGEVGLGANVSLVYEIMN